MIKALRCFVVIIILIAGGGFLYYHYFFVADELSPDQQEIVNTFGYPKRFTISYLQYAEEGDDMLIRQEVWYYPSHQQAISFVGGDILSVNKIEEEVSESGEIESGEITYSSLKPEDFEFEMDYDAVAAALGTETIEAVDMVPELYTKGELETYVSDHVIFTLEHGYLTYFETVGLDLGEEEET